MDGLIQGHWEANRPAFRFEGPSELTASPPPSGELALTGPSVKMEAGHLPVRGDLAHIKLAGRCFVPHYAVPMPHRAKPGAVLRVAERNDADVIQPLPEGARFDVLDIAGPWTWGQLGEDGPVGYVALADLDRVA